MGGCGTIEIVVFVFTIRALLLCERRFENLAHKTVLILSATLVREEGLFCSLVPVLCCLYAGSCGNPIVQLLLL